MQQVYKRYNKDSAFSIVFSNYYWYYKYSNLDNINTLIKLVNFLFHLDKAFTNTRTSWLYAQKILYLKPKIISESINILYFTIEQIVILLSRFVLCKWACWKLFIFLYLIIAFQLFRFYLTIQIEFISLRSW